MHTRLPEHEKSSRPPPSLLDFMPTESRQQKKTGKKGRSQTSGCSDDRAANSDALRVSSELADALVEDVDDNMAKIVLVPDAKLDSASGTRPSPAA